MGIFLVLFLTATLTNSTFSFFASHSKSPKIVLKTAMQSNIPKIVDKQKEILAENNPSFENSLQFLEIKNMLARDAATMSPLVVDKILRTLKCTTEYHVQHNNILSVIDYSMPSNKKRFWVFDLNKKMLLFHTYVSHGIKSGTLFTNFFSNKNNSKASSIGVYKTDKAYYGREGLSLRLAGLEVSFNDNASNRSIVMHGGWYMSEDFIKKYGRPGRSWGCPAVPKDLFQAIINTIKENSLFVVYYPTENWLVKSRFLNCESTPFKLDVVKVQREVKPALGENELRDDVLFADLSKLEAIVTMPADSYERIFQTKPPLGRMLRRQIDHREYIALSTSEFNQLAARKQTEDPALLDTINLVTPELKLIRGYYETQMKIIPLGKIKDLKAENRHYSINFESRPSLNLKISSQFIRWLGL